MLLGKERAQRAAVRLGGLLQTSLTLALISYHLCLGDPAFMHSGCSHASQILLHGLLAGRPAHMRLEPCT